MSVPDVVVWIMVILVSLVVGFLIGWVSEYYIDLRHWKRRAEMQGFTLVGEQRIVAAEATAQPAMAGLSEADTKIDAQLAATLQEFLEKREAEINSLRDGLDRQKAEYEGLEHRFEQYVASHPDDLTAIRGIGRIYQWKLRDAGISSYSQLASTTPDQLREVLEVPAWRKFDPESWIEQAKAHAQRGE